MTTWGGEKSQADIEAEKEERRRNRKTWGDHYEAEIDSGKVQFSVTVLTLLFWRESVWVMSE